MFKNFVILGPNNGFILYHLLLLDFVLKMVLNLFRWKDLPLHRNKSTRSLISFNMFDLQNIGNMKSTQVKHIYKIFPKIQYERIIIIWACSLGYQLIRYHPKRKKKKAIIEEWDVCNNDLGFFMMMTKTMVNASNTL